MEGVVQFIYLTSLIVRGKKLVRKRGDKGKARENLSFLGKGDCLCKAEVRRAAWRRINKMPEGKRKETSRVYSQTFLVALVPE